MGSFPACATTVGSQWLDCLSSRPLSSWFSWVSQEGLSRCLSGDSRQLTECENHFACISTPFSMLRFGLRASNVPEHSRFCLWLQVGLLDVTAQWIDGCAPVPVELHLTFASSRHHYQWLVARVLGLCRCGSWLSHLGLVSHCLWSSFWCLAQSEQTKHAVTSIPRAGL